MARGSSHGRVLIIGAGLGGLALAQGLKKYRIPFTLFERDGSSTSRPQGYRIKVFPDTAADLKYLLPDNLWDDFKATCAVTNMGESTLNALDAGFIASRRNFGPCPYTVDRGAFRAVLVKDLNAEEIQWGKSFVHYILHGNGTEVSACFEDGSVEKGALLVGADGGRSPVRKQFLPKYTHLDTQGCVIFGKTPITPELEKEVTPKAMKWITVCRDLPPALQGVIIGELPITLIIDTMRFQNRDTRDDIPDDYVYWAIVVPSTFLGSNEEMLAAALKKPVNELSLLVSSEWSTLIRPLLLRQDSSQTAALRIVSAPPEIPAWEPESRITLLGDAIHVMSPAGGVGAVTALKDASTLTKALIAEGISTASIGAYDAAMRVYAGASISRSFAGGKKLYGQPPFDQCHVISI
ncbi:hypothetical protein MMC20_001977 [Loxospora ochrophaea]|nr:hypothetical protein [Loxospora ochrophaea]